MFSLIITIISIALVAALALATLYYGGDAFNSGRSKAEAARALNEGQQLLGAADIFRAKNGRWPRNVQELVSSEHLSTVPVAAGQSMGTAVAQAVTTWTMPEDYVPVFERPVKEVPVCKEINAQSYGADGVLKEVYDSFMVQCWGPSTQNLKVVFAKSSSTYGDVTAYQPVLETGPLPASTDEDAWLVKPGEAVVGGGTPPSAQTNLALSVDSGSFTLSGDAASGYRVGFSGSDFGYLRITNNGAESATFTVEGTTDTNLFTYFATGDDFIEDMGFSEEDVQAMGIDICRRNQTLAAAQSCLVEVYLETSPSYPSLTFNGTTVTVDVGASLSVFPNAGRVGESYFMLPGGQELTTFNVTNNGSQPLTGVSVSSSGASAYALQSTCGTNLAEGASCNVTVLFNPSAAGTHDAIVTFSTNETGSVQRNFSNDAVEPAVVATLNLNYGSAVAPAAGTLQMSFTAMPGYNLQDLVTPFVGGDTVQVSASGVDNSFSNPTASLPGASTWTVTLTESCGGSVPCYGNSAATATVAYSMVSSSGDFNNKYGGSIVDVPQTGSHSYCVAYGNLYGSKMSQSRPGSCN